MRAMPRKGYKDRVNQQGRDWVNGASDHNDVDNECTPDFSCCEPSLFTRDREKRIKNFNVWAARNGYPLFSDS